MRVWALGAFNALARVDRDSDLRVAPDRYQSSLALGDIVALFEQAGLLEQRGNMLIFACGYRHQNPQLPSPEVSPIMHTSSHATMSTNRPS